VLSGMAVISFSNSARASPKRFCATSVARTEPRLARRRVLLDVVGRTAPPGSTEVFWRT